MTTISLPSLPIRPQRKCLHQTCTQTKLPSSLRHRQVSPARHHLVMRCHRMNPATPLRLLRLLRLLLGLLLLLLRHLPHLHRHMMRVVVRFLCHLRSQQAVPRCLHRRPHRRLHLRSPRTKLQDLHRLGLLIGLLLSQRCSLLFGHRYIHPLSLAICHRQRHRHYHRSTHRYSLGLSPHLLLHIRRIIAPAVTHQRAVQAATRHANQVRNQRPFRRGVP